jgi:LSD1 subclass zinc finger protein
MEEKIIHVSCPSCSNKRLFDLERGATGMVSIKCPKCKAIVVIKLQNAIMQK